jgi:hypothetical protein
MDLEEFKNVLRKLATKLEMSGSKRGSIVK